jgi:phosphate transport system substrate-binding protein
LAPRLIAEYKKEHPAAAFDIESIATGYGLAQLRAGLCDLAGASREPIKEEQELAKASAIELNDHVIGAYSTAVVVNNGNPVSNLTKDQVRDIFTGTIKNWKDVGGNDAAIQLYIRDPISGTYLGFQELAMEKKPYASGSKTFTNYAGIIQAVAADPNGIGYSGFDMAKVSGGKAVSIGGVPPTADSVNTGKYPYARMLRFYTNKSRESKPAMEFVQFVQSEKGQAVVAQLGLVPHR